jgi:transposase InsO family protein
MGTTVREPRAYSVAQLEEIGCGIDTTVRRRYFPEQGGSLTVEQFIYIVVKNKPTRHIPFHLLTAKDQGKVSAWETKQELVKIQEIAARVAVDPPVFSTPSPRPRVYYSPAALAGAAAARKIKEQQAQAIEDRLQQKAEYLAMYQCQPESAKQAAKAKHYMITACETFLRESGYRGRVKEGRQRWNTKGGNVFCQAVIDGTLEVPAWVAEFLTRKGKLSVVLATLLNWRDRYEEMGLYGLADHYVSKAGATTLTETLQIFVIGMIHDYPHAKPSAIHKALKARFKGEKLPSKHSVNRFMSHWKETNANLYLYITNPDEWRSRHMFAFGDADEDVTRLNMRWEADSTKADVICTDGRCCVIGLIDVWSRRAKLHVSATAKTSANAALLRRSLIGWGVPEEFRTDCGSDYTSFHLERICDALDVNHHLCNEFHPEEKPHIERFFHTFSHDIVELLPGYVGHSVADRKDIEARKSFARRLMTKGETVEIKLTIAELQELCDRWTESVYHQNPHSGLDGMTPAAKARSWTGPIARIPNERALDILLYPAPSNNGMRKIGKKGIECTFGGVKLYYKAVEFAGHEGEWVQVLIDETDLGRAPVFLDNGEFLALAEDPRWYGISNKEVASHAKAKQKKILKEQKAEVKKIAKQADTRNIVVEILKGREEETANVLEFPKKAAEYSTPALEEAALAVAERERKAETVVPVVITEEMRRAVEPMLQPKKIQSQDPPELEKFFELRKKVHAGTATESERGYVENFEQKLMGKAVNQ